MSSQISRSGRPLESTSLPGAEILAQVRRLLIVGVLSVVGYSMFAKGSKGYCPGGVTADGGFIDAAGDATDNAPLCVNLTLQPSGLVLIAIAAIVIGALSLVLRRAANVPSAIRYLDRAAAAVVILAVASLVISHVWFAMIPITEWNGTGTFFYPFPFGSVELETAPMSVG